MTMRFRQHLLLPVLAAGLALSLAAPTRAEERKVETGTDVTSSMQVDTAPELHWTSIGSSRVEELPSAERPAYDMYRYGGTYYVYNNNRWYSSSRERGEFTSMDERSVPSEFSNIPREHWRNFPTAWQDRGQQPAGGAPAMLRVNLGPTPHWTAIRGTKVESLPAAERPNYDMFRYAGTYYVHNNDRWYMSPQGSGDFNAIDDRDVPEEFSVIPREQWQSYPSGWKDRHDEGWDRAPATMQVTYGFAPRWTTIRGTRVQQISGRQRPPYDLFRLDKRYYAFNNNRWYMSDRGKGEFASLNDRNVPAELMRIPRKSWRNYPDRWLDEKGNPRANNQGGGQ